MKGKTLTILTLVLITFSDIFSCTIFTYTNNGKTYFCNNEDYSNPDTEIRFYPSKRGKYAWVYLGFSNNWAQGGVNEKGLCWDWVAGNIEESWKEDKSKRTFKGNLSQRMIAKCATVDEAIVFFKKYNDNSFSYARIMLADKYGNSAIIGWKEGNIFVDRINGNLLSLGYGEEIVNSYFENTKGEKDMAYMAKALFAAHQKGQYPTQYSNIISLNEGMIIIYNKRNHDEFAEIDYLAKLNKGFSCYKIQDLFNKDNKFSDISLRKQFIKAF